MTVLPVVVCATCLAPGGCDEKREEIAEFVGPDGGRAATVYAGHWNVTVRDSVFVYVADVGSGPRLFHSRKLVLFCGGRPDLVKVQWTSADRLSIRFAATGRVVRRETSADGVSIAFAEIPPKTRTPA